jgi:glyoxylase-like metal-dependent hydrolase (beta-lactamase superfamily II)
VILEDGEEMDFEGIRVKCIYTPGHSDCSVCYKIGENLFSGDTIFKGSIGRCDLPTGNMDIIEDSIRNIIYKMDDDTVIYPGHGGSTTVGYEKKYNPYFSE